MRQESDEISSAFERPHEDEFAGKAPVGSPSGIRNLKDRRPVQRTGAGSRDRTGILSLEGCCTTIVLYPRNAGLASPLVWGLFSVARGGGSRTRTCEGVSQRIYSPPRLATPEPTRLFSPFSATTQRLSGCPENGERFKSSSYNMIEQ